MVNRPDSNPVRMAKNTVFLYIRMFLILLVNLFTVRVVLKAMGAEDFGVYNVVGGIVTMFAFLSSTMSSGSQRFFAFALGKKDPVLLGRYFSLSMIAYIGLSLVFFILVETIGLWFLYHYLVIPPDRMQAAFWVFQLSVLTFFASFVSIPYNAMILAHEKMTVYAYISIFEALVKLGLVFSLLFIGGDTLILYAFMLLISTLFTALVYGLYSRKYYAEARLRWFWDRSMFVEIIGFSGWNLVGAISGVLRNQGINILLNVFFGPIINAARAISYQVGGAMSQFVTNFLTAIQPQIVKSYALNQRKEILNLVFMASKITFFLVFVLSIPVLFDTPVILRVWLNEYPSDAALFTQLVVVMTLVESLGSPLLAAVQATGRVKWYQLVTGGLLLMNFPVSYVLLKKGYSPESTLYVGILVAILAHFSRMIFVKRLLNLSLRSYVKDVFLRLLFVAFFSIVPVFFVHGLLPEGITRFFVVAFLNLMISILLMYRVGLNAQERMSLSHLLKNRLNRG